MKITFKKVLTFTTVSTLFAGVLVGCSGNNVSADNQIDTTNLTLEEIETKAKEEGEVNSVGMPDTWANWKETWEDLNTIYGLSHVDTDMSSAEEIAKFEAEKNNATADIGDVGVSFGPVAEAKGVTLPYKTSYWDEIPEWAKDDNGDWIVGYTGAIAVITDKTKVNDAPKTWEDLKNGDYKISLSDVTTATQGQSAVLAAAIAHGGDETNIEPGVEFFKEIAKDGRLSLVEPDLATLEKGEIEVALMWDFNALNYADQIDRDRYEVSILEEGSIMSGYATIINKYSKNPHAAMLAREYILSDEGQINLAKGYARPIREVELPTDVQEKLLPNEQYENVEPVNDHEAWEETVKQLSTTWQQEVLIHAK